MSPTVRALIQASVSGAILGGILFVIGAPVWAAIAFAVIQAEIRQSRILAATPPVVNIHNAITSAFAAKEATR